MALLWLTSPDGKYRVVVGEWEYRQDMALDVVSSQLTPWLVALPVMLLLLIVLLSRELKPLKSWHRPCARARRMPPMPCPPRAYRRKCAPARLAESSLCAYPEMMTRERRFTSDAAHELRSPLAALKVQTDVAQLSQDDPQAQEKR